MATNIQQNVVGVSSTPTNGQPWNFNGLLETYALPRVIAADSALLPGARILWAIIRQHSWRDGRCVLSDKALAAAVGVEWRQCIRYCRQLERTQLLRTTTRPGQTTVRELLWDTRFAGKLRKPPVLEDSPPCLGRQTPLSSKTATYKVIRSSLDPQKTSPATIEKTAASAAPSLPARPRPPVRTDEEIIRHGRACGFPEHVIQRDLERARARRAHSEGESIITAAQVVEREVASIPR